MLKLIYCNSKIGHWLRSWSENGLASLIAIAESEASQYDEAEIVYCTDGVEIALWDSTQGMRWSEKEEENFALGEFTDVVDKTQMIGDAFVPWSPAPIILG